MAIITSTATGDWDAGGTWVGGVAPGTGDDAIIANLHVVTLTADQVTGSCEIQAGGTIADGGFELTLDSESGAGYTFYNKAGGTISGALDILFSYNGKGLFANVGTGNVRNLTVNGGASTQCAYIPTGMTFDGNVTLIAGDPSATMYPNNTAYTLIINGNLTIASGTLFGRSGWTGALTVGGSIYNYGIWLSATTQVVTFGGVIYGPGTYPSSVAVPNIEYPADADKFADVDKFRDFNLQGD